MTKNEAIYNGYIEIVPYTNEEVEVKVEIGEDEFGLFIIVYWNNTKSSKIRYETAEI